MKPNNRVTAIAAWMLLFGASAFAAPAELPGDAEKQDRSTAVLTAQVSTRSASAPLEMRVSVQYVNSKTADVLQVLAKAAGLTVDLPAASLPAVTLTLTNVRLRTALEAICDTAACTWRLEGTTLKIASAGISPAGGLPPTVSLELEQVPAEDVFRAIAAAIGVALVVEGRVEQPPLTVKFTNAATTTVLDFVCKRAGCSWEFDAASRQLRVRFNAP